MSETTNKPLFSKPTVNTQFHIDFEWWQTKDPTWRTVMYSYLCEEHRAYYTDENNFGGCLIDVVDPETGEVTQSDPLLGILMTHCAQQEGFISESGALTDTVFRILLKNSNEPLTARELSEYIGKPAETILKTLTARVFQGIRPL